MVKRKNIKGGEAVDPRPMDEDRPSTTPLTEPMKAEEQVALPTLQINPPSEDFLSCLTNFQAPSHLKKAIIQFMVADSKHDMNFTLKDYDKIFSALMLLPDFPQQTEIEDYINNASTSENLHTRLSRIINQYTGMPANDGVNVLKELDEDSQIYSYSPYLYRILNDKSTSVDFEKVDIHGSNWLFQKYVMRNSQGEFDPIEVLTSIRDLHGLALPNNEYRLLLSLDDATFLAKIMKNIGSLNNEAIRRSQEQQQEEIYTLNVLLLHENLMDPGSSFNLNQPIPRNSNININMIRPDEDGNITINGINIGSAGPWMYQKGQSSYTNGFFSRATVNAGPIRKSGNNYSSDINITAPVKNDRAAAEQDTQPINYPYTATTGADPTSNCRKFLKSMLTSIAILCMDRTTTRTRQPIYELLMKDSLLMQSKRMGDTGLGLIFLRLKEQLGDTVFNELGKPVCSTIDRLAALSYNMMGINYMFFMRGGDQLEYYTCIREANIQTSEERELIYDEKIKELKIKVEKLKTEYREQDITTLLDKAQTRLQEIYNFLKNITKPIEDLVIKFSDINHSLKKQLYKIYIKRKKERFFDSIFKKKIKINNALSSLQNIDSIDKELYFEIYSLIYQVLNFNIESFINPEGSEENYSMFLEIENAYYDPYIPRRRGRSSTTLTLADKVNIPDFSTIKLLFNKLNIDQNIYEDYLSTDAPGTKIQQYYYALNKEYDIDNPQTGGRADVSLLLPDTTTTPDTTTIVGKRKFLEINQPPNSIEIIKQILENILINYLSSRNGTATTTKTNTTEKNKRQKTDKQERQANSRKARNIKLHQLRRIRMSKEVEYGSFDYLNEFANDKYASTDILVDIIWVLNNALFHINKYIKIKEYLKKRNLVTAEENLEKDIQKAVKQLKEQLDIALIPRPPIPSKALFFPPPVGGKMFSKQNGGKGKTKNKKNVKKTRKSKKNIKKIKNGK